MPNIIQFCPIPIYLNTINFSDADFHNLISEEIVRLSAGNGYGTLNSNVLNSEKYCELKKTIQHEVDFFVHDILLVNKDIKFNLEHSWVVKHETGDWSQGHYHVNGMITGVLYLNVDDNSGSIIFHKERSWENLFPRSIDMPFVEFNSLNSSTWKITPKIGDIVLFPSHLYHSVTENLSDITRYCLSFNFYPRGTFGVYDNAMYQKITI
jgi:uncharacterized protein (TIGR02466 family)